MRYYCDHFTGNQGGSEQSAEMSFRSLPPLLVFTLWDHDTRQTWQLYNTRLNFQSRDSLRTLRNHDAWEIGRGFEGRGLFRAIEPTQSSTVLPLAIMLNVEISWDPVFLNITGQSGNDWLLWSTRAGAWAQPNHPPPLLVYLQANPINPPEGRTTHVRITEVNERNEFRRTRPQANEIMDVSRSSTDVDHDEVPQQAARSNPDPVVVEVIQEAPINHRTAPDTVPIENGSSLVVSNQPPNPAIMLNDLQAPHAIAVRPRQAADNQLVNQNVRERVTIGTPKTMLRRPPPMFVNTVPQMPASPKPRPPNPPSTTHHRILENNQILRTLDVNFHPRLMSVGGLSPGHFSNARPPQAGMINPPLPILDHFARTYPKAPESLRTTEQGIRLEITPAAMSLREPPEEQRPIVTPPTPPPESESFLPPELDPEA